MRLRIGAVALIAVARPLAAAPPAAAQGGAVSSPCCRSRTPARTGRTRRSSRGWSSALPAVLASALDRHPGRRVVTRQARPRGDATGSELGPAQRVDAAAAAQVGQGDRRPATPSPAASRISTASSGSMPGWWTRKTGEIVKVVSNDDPKLQDRPSSPPSFRWWPSGSSAPRGCSPIPPGPPLLPSPPRPSPPSGVVCCTKGG